MATTRLNGTPDLKEAGKVLTIVVSFLIKKNLKLLLNLQLSQSKLRLKQMVFEKNITAKSISNLTFVGTQLYLAQNF